MMVELFQWIAIAAFLSLFVGRTLQMRFSHGIRVVSLVREKPRGEAALGALFVLAVFLFAIDMVLHTGLVVSSGLSPRVDPVLFEPGWWGVGGAALQVGGLAVFAWSLLSFGRSWRVGVDRKSPGDLVTTGIFALSRNPIFLSMDLFLLGSVLLTGRLFPLIFALGAMAGFHFQILNEERFLEARHGDAYRRYRRRVGRYLGGGSSVAGIGADVAPGGGRGAGETTGVAV